MCLLSCARGREPARIFFGSPTQTLSRTPRLPVDGAQGRVGSVAVVTLTAQTLGAKEAKRA